MLIIAGTRSQPGTGTPVVYNIVFQWQIEMWVCGEVVLPGGKRHRLMGGELPDVPEDKIAEAVPRVVGFSIDSLDGLCAMEGAPPRTSTSDGISQKQQSPGALTATGPCSP
jgi:hypothetical protein